MGTQDIEKGIILVHLAEKLQVHDELQRVIDRVLKQGDSSVVVDFSDVIVAGGTMLTRLLELQRLLQDRGHTLVLCSVAPAVKDVFAVTRLDEVFDFVKDKVAALDHIQTC